ncbi:DUF3131 domain-containing protein [Caldibacillus lycopersici]|uniref:DUF3131 domain-containing protein n=1 Tax=Perspicuibacillus lycopersici TaxID=1325689 RepID=A0AAE3LMG1_9BACI|nr:glucoamylase family protein [Perspicuibacillus lycopersici]MCU9612687.1 DUF3131 domain-containing protein [Perspicuibacillus lycopersici]
MNKKILIAISSIVIVILVVAIIVFSLNNRQATKIPLEGEFEEELFSIAEDTYQFFSTYTNPDTGLTDDRVDVNGETVTSGHTSPTNIAMYMTSTISAAKLGIISKADAKDNIKVVVNTLEKMEKWNGLFYNWYNTKDGSVKKDWGQFISTVDNGWLTAALVVTGQYFPELNKLTEPMIEKMDYAKLYDPQVGQLWGGYDVAQGKYTDSHYGMLYSETRLASYISIGKGDVPEDHWFKLYRTFLPKDNWQSQQPEGEYVNINGINVYEGHYEYEGIKYVPSWGGSMFEALMPTLYLNEKELGTKALGLNDARYVEAQIKYAENMNYPAWGFSPAATQNSYQEFGVKELGTSGYEDRATVTPHASILALDYAPEEVSDNIKKLKELGVYGELGFYDTINLKTNKVAKTYLSLDQGMIMISITNYLTDGSIRDYFHKDEIGKDPEHLLTDEEFSIGQ